MYFRAVVSLACDAVTWSKRKLLFSAGSHQCLVLAGRSGRSWLSLPPTYHDLTFLELMASVAAPFVEDERNHRIA